MEREIIEIAPLAYMRGRTLDDAFVILDEAQNTTIIFWQLQFHEISEVLKDSLEQLLLLNE